MNRRGRTTYTPGQVNAIDDAILKALDPNGATLKHAEIVEHVGGFVTPELRSRWDFAIKVGQRLQAFRQAGRIEYRRGPGSGWRHARV